MRRVFTKYYNGFTLSILHDSAHCVRCMKLCTFYNKMKNKEPPWDETDGNNKCAASKYKFFGVISYLSMYIRIEYIPYEQYKNTIFLQDPVASIELINGDEICYFREVTVEERIIIDQQVNGTFTSDDLPDKDNADVVETRRKRNSTLRTSLSYHGYRKIVKNAVKSVTDRTRERTAERTLKDRFIHCKNIRKVQAQKKDLHKVQNPSPKGHNDKKEPGKGTLKRKRWYLDKLRSNDGYEDDIFEEKNFYSFHNMLDEEEESDFSDVENMATPKWSISLSPRERSVSPTYEDCYSPHELSVSRKEAEEYQFRRFKRRKTMLMGDKTGSSSQQIKSESPDSTKVLESVCKILMQQPKAEKDSGSESDDSYFTDSSEDES